MVFFEWELWIRERRGLTSDGLTGIAVAKSTDLPEFHFRTSLVVPPSGYDCLTDNHIGSWFTKRNHAFLGKADTSSNAALVAVKGVWKTGSSEFR